MNDSIFFFFFFSEDEVMLELPALPGAPWRQRLCLRHISIPMCVAVPGMSVFPNPTSAAHRPHYNTICIPTAH